MKHACFVFLPIFKEIVVQLIQISAEKFPNKRYGQDIIQSQNRYGNYVFTGQERKISPCNTYY